MSVHKDERKTGTWFVHVRYNDWTGQQRQHRKRGFATKREAQEYERLFLSEQECVGLSLSQLLSAYINDAEHRLRQSSLETMKVIFRRITPYLGDMLVKDITPAIVRKFQLKLIDDGYSAGTVKTTIGELSALMNYGVRYYNLSSNPCPIAGTVKQPKQRQIEVWTNDEFLRFMQTRRTPLHKLLYPVLFYTGMRLGELLGLTWADIDGDVIHITKQWLYRQKKFGQTKTPQSVRDVPIPDFLADMLSVRPYDTEPTDRIFNISADSIEAAMRSGARKAGLPVIRVHGLRHSHISMLLSMGVPAPAVAKRVGHANANVTLSVYAHAYKHDEIGIAKLLDNAIKKEPATLPAIKS